VSQAMELAPVPLTATTEGVASSTKVRLSGPTVSESAAAWLLPPPAPAAFSPSAPWTAVLLQPRAAESASAPASPTRAVVLMNQGCPERPVLLKENDAGVAPGRLALRATGRGGRRFSA